MGQVISEDSLIIELQRQKRNGRRIVFTNGCFDLLHPGHVSSLEQARSLGDCLVVGLNDDASVRLLKGPERPLLSERERAAILAALAAVDYVVLFSQPTPRELIARIAPDILAKGADWNGLEIAGRDEVESTGGEVRTLNLDPGYSTTRLLDELKRMARGGASAASRGFLPDGTERG